MKKFLIPKLRVITLIPIIAVLVPTLLPVQESWAAFIFCPITPQECNGTPQDDLIIAAGHANTIVHGLGGNDIIKGHGPLPDVLWGDEGNDTLLGSEGNDYLNGGLGNDNYDGSFGADTIYEDNATMTVNSDDVISGGAGNDFIYASFGIDKIHGGMGNDLIYPGTTHRDFTFDYVDCGMDTGDQVLVSHSADGDEIRNCEHVVDFDR